MDRLFELLGNAVQFAYTCWEAERQTREEAAQAGVIHDQQAWGNRAECRTQPHN